MIYSFLAISILIYSYWSVLWVKIMSAEYSWNKFVYILQVSKQIVDKALELGINFFDTAEVCYLAAYIWWCPHIAGISGAGFYCNRLIYLQAYLNSEKVLGRILEGRRKDVVIASKFGARLSEVYTPQDIEQSLMTSLQRLRTDYIDLYQVRQNWKTFWAFNTHTIWYILEAQSTNARTWVVPVLCHTEVSTYRSRIV